MSDHKSSSAPPELDKRKEKPRWRPESRKRFALAKYYGIGDESWTIEQIADYLRVQDETVAKYIFESDMGDKVARRLADVQAQTRIEVAMKLFDQLDRLDEIEEALLKEKRAVISGYKPQTVSGVPEMEGQQNFNITDAPELEFNVPVAEEMDEVPNIDQVTDIWEEKREVIQDIEDLLGLEEPEQVEVDSEHREMKMEKKVYEFRDSDVQDELPDQDPKPLGEKYGDDNE